MIYAHLSAVERTILALASVAANTGHPVHKGTAREWFLRDFLTAHLSERVAVGSGQVIDAKSQPGQPRNQHDAVIYRRDYPKLSFGGGVTGFLAESVVATIEVKSSLDESGLSAAIATANRTKSLARNFVYQSPATGYVPPSILCYVVAYAGPANLQTVQDWIIPALTTHNIANPSLPPHLGQRTLIPSPGLDGIFILGKGFLLYDNGPISILDDSVRAANPQLRWVRLETLDQNLLILFLQLTTAVSSVSTATFNPTSYVTSISGINHAVWSI